MVSTPVSGLVKLLIARMLTEPSTNARPVVENIELFRHALEPSNILFGTARVNGQIVALPETILAALRALTPSTPALPMLPRAEGRPRMAASRLRYV